MFVSTCGFGSTGSSAVNDYLMECDNTVGFDAVEFTISTMVDGLEDLEYHLMKQNTRLSSSIYAIQRFRKAMYAKAREWASCTQISENDVYIITDKFIDSITQLKFVGFSPKIDKKHSEFIRRYFGESIVLHRLIPKMEEKGLIKSNFDFYPLDEVCASIKPKKFYELSQRFIRTILHKMGYYWDDSQYLVMDQAFAGNDPAKSFPFYKDSYAIVVDRDPRDLYIFAKKFLLHRGRFMPTDTVENFIIYYRMLREDQPYKKENSRILFIQFEDMVYNYDETSKKIDEFLKLSNNRRKTIFVPEMSAANTNLVRKFPEFRDDICLIEKNLPEYLFDFNVADGSIVGNGKMFFGKSPLNK